MEVLLLSTPRIVDSKKSLNGTGTFVPIVTRNFSLIGHFVEKVVKRACLSHEMKMSNQRSKKLDFCRARLYLTVYLFIVVVLAVSKNLDSEVIVVPMVIIFLDPVVIDFLVVNHHL